MGNGKTWMWDMDVANRRSAFSYIFFFIHSLVCKLTSGNTDTPLRCRHIAGTLCMQEIIGSRSLAGLDHDIHSSVP